MINHGDRARRNAFVNDDFFWDGHVAERNV